MATLVSPVSKRGRLSLGTRCQPRREALSTETELAEDPEKLYFKTTRLFPDDNCLDDRPASSMDYEEMQSNYIYSDHSSPNERSESPTFHTSISEDKMSFAISGLPNCGNTCYLNSVLYVLRYTPNFLEYLHYLMLKYEPERNDLSDTSESMGLACLKQLHSLYASMKMCEDSVCAAKELNGAQNVINELSLFIESLRQIVDQFGENQQHDAHEFLVVLITSLPSCLKQLDISFSSSASDSPISITRKRKKRRFSCSKYRRTNKKVHKDSGSGETFSEVDECNSIDHILDDILYKSGTCEVLSSLFQGKLCQVVQCLECEESKMREEVFFDVKVPLITKDSHQTDMEERVSLLDCLMKESLLDGENKYFCEHCLHYNEAKLTYKVTHSSSVLLLHLSWLSDLSSMNESEKTETRVSVPFTLGSSSQCNMFSMYGGDFQLYAAIVHIGASSADGHYVSLIKLSSEHYSSNSNLENCEDTSGSSTTFNGFLPKETIKCCSKKSLDDVDEKSYPEKDIWFLFDDDTIASLNIGESGFLPYFECCGPTATPYMLFYQKM